MRAIVLRFTLVSVFFVGLVVFNLANEETVEIDSKSGLRIDSAGSWKLIKANCSVCHSERLLTQQQLDRENWAKSIKRMQTQENLWDLGDNESKVLDYLSSYYGVSNKSKSQRVRRAQLKVVEFTPLPQSEPPSPSNEQDTSSNESDSNDDLLDSPSLDQNEVLDHEE